MIVLPDQVITAAGGRGRGRMVITLVRSGCHPDTETRGPELGQGLVVVVALCLHKGEVNMNNYWVSTLAKPPAENY